MREVPRMGPGEFEPPEASDLQKLFPDFEVKRLVGRGGMGAVYEAFQRDLERQVALKILPPETADDLEFQERFRREAATLAKLDHPNIVKLFDYGEREGYFYFIMEYVEGADLSALMSDGEFPPQEVLTIVGQGVLLYELLTGKVPAGSFKSPSERRAGLGPRFDEVVLKALREDPEQRQQTATEVKSGLEEVI